MSELKFNVTLPGDKTPHQLTVAESEAMVRTWMEDARVIDEAVDKATLPNHRKIAIQTVAGTELSLTRAEAAAFSGMLRSNAKGLRKVMEKAQAKSKALQLKEWERQNPNLPKAGKN